MSARFSAIVLPVTVSASPCSRPASSRARMTTGTPPIASMSVITYRPNGLTSARCGTLSPMRLKSSRVSSTFASLAIASRCSTALVEPPSAITTVIAFSNACLVRIVRAVMPASTRATTASPERSAKASRRESGDGGDALPGSDMPSASAAEAIVLAVYMPPHAPSPGQIARSMASTSSRVILPARQAPTASNASMIVTSRAVVLAGQGRAGVEEGRSRRRAGPRPSACRGSTCRSRRAAPRRRAARPGTPSRPSRR